MNAMNGVRSVYSDGSDAEWQAGRQGGGEAVAGTVFRGDTAALVEPTEVLRASPRGVRCGSLGCRVRDASAVSGVTPRRRADACSGFSIAHAAGAPGVQGSRRLPYIGCNGAGVSWERWQLRQGQREESPGQLVKVYMEVVFGCDVCTPSTGPSCPSQLPRPAGRCAGCEIPLGVSPRVVAGSLLGHL